MKMMKAHFTLWVVLLLGGFLAGFVPEYQKNTALRKELENPQRMIDDLQRQARLGEVRDAAGQMLLEISRQNYGLAREQSGQFYNKLKAVVESTQDPNVKKSLQELLDTQNALVHSLNVGDASSLAAAQPIVLRTYELTKNVK